jgi:tetratricopeptide (TPR) repeat protein
MDEPAGQPDVRWLQTTAQATPRAPEKAEDPHHCDVIGRFIVLGVLGRGGMSVVHAAYDPHLDRKVAVKLLDADAQGQADQVRARLLREARAMAKIDHFNVIKVHEVGTHAGAVYVAMELAEGGTLRRWLAHAPRNRAEVFAAFVQAGHGLAAAHAAGLIHRDFKPDNVLMTKTGTARVTDFGLVKRLGGEHAPSEAVPPRDSGGDTAPLAQPITRAGAVMGTPIYMAPEQFEGRAATAATDQFAFCVALCEALCGKRPFSGSTFEELAANVIAGKAAVPASADIPGWLRRILLRGLSADPAARFPTMAILLAELTRDRRRRRHRYLAVAGVTALVAGGVVAYASWPSAAVACRAGSERFATVWSPARRAALVATFQATDRPHAAASLAKVGELADAWGRDWQRAYVDACEDTRVRSTRSEHALDLRMDCLDRRLAEVDATFALLAADGGGVVDRAVDAVLQLPRVTPCADVARLEAAVPPPDTAEAQRRVDAVRTRLDDVRAQIRVGHHARARAPAQDALEAARATGYLPIIADALIQLGAVQYRLADPAATTTLRDAIRAAAAAGDRGQEIEATSWFASASVQDPARHDLALEFAALAESAADHSRPAPDAYVRLENAHGAIELERGKTADARARVENTLAYAERTLGPSPATGSTRDLLGRALVSQGKLEDARAVLERAVAERAQVFGDDHPDVANGLDNLAIVYRREGKLDDAARLEQRGLSIRIAAFGPTHPDVAKSYNNLGLLTHEQGDLDGAVAYFSKARAIWDQVYGPDNLDTAGALQNEGNMLAEQGKRDQARVMFERSRALYEKLKGPNDPGVASAFADLGELAYHDHDLDGALGLERRAEQLLTRALGPDHPNVGEVLASEASVLADQGRLVDAQSLAERVLSIRNKVYGADHVKVAEALSNLGGIQRRRGDSTAALSSYEKSVAIFEAKRGKDYPRLWPALLGIGRCLDDLNRRVEAVPPLERALALRLNDRGAPDSLADIHDELAHALFGDPSMRARARAEAKLALAGYEQAKSPNAAAVRAWLAHH